MALDKKNTIVWYRRFALTAAVLCFVVVMMGAYVRLSTAGLGCPDWPTCYGHITAGGALDNQANVNAAYPHRPLEYAKAIKEMMHRYAAGVLGIAIAFLFGWAVAKRRDPQQPVLVPTLLLFVVIFQAALGMWTVTLLLKPLIVTAHLLGGMATLGLLWWLSMKPEPFSSGSVRPSIARAGKHDADRDDGALRGAIVKGQSEAASSLRRFTVIALILLVVQIALGGWTSSNYAAVACPDFPHCQAQWWPHADFREGFVLWRGLGIDYEGGVLDHPARVAIHLTHRIGAVLITLIVGALGILTVLRANSRRVRNAGIAVLAALVLQLAIGISMVLKAFPLSLATFHNTGAALLLLALITLLRRPCTPTGN